MLKIAVTGGAGFIGSHLCKKLISDLHEVTIIDNLDPYYSIEQKKLHIQEITRTGPFKYIDIDLRDEKRVEEIFEEYRFDTVVHLAALPGVSYSVQKPLLYLEYDIKATVNVLSSAGRTEVDHVVFASSSSVYGNQENGAFHEEMKVGEVESPYAAAKSGAESFCHTFHKLYGFRMTVLRFFTVYGPWGRPDMAIPKFTRKLLSNEPIEVYSLDSARDYTFINDCIQGLEKAIHHTSHEFETINIASGKPIRMDELLKIFQNHFPRMEVIEKPWRTGDVKMTWADISKASKLLGYSPKIDINEGIERTIQWSKVTFE